MNAPGKGIDDCRATLNGTFNRWFDSLRVVTVNPESTAQALALELLRPEVDALKSLTHESAVTRDNAQARAIKLAAGFYKDTATREEVIRIASDVFGVPVDELSQQVEQTRTAAVQKFQAERKPSPPLRSLHCR